MSWREVVPVAVLVGVASIQLILARTLSLSPWKGGGFGMFATNDDAGSRYVRVFVTAPDRSEELTIPDSLEDTAARAAVLPSEAMLGRLARRVVAREQRYQRPVASLRIEAWRIEYAPGTLAATTRLIRTFEHRVDTTAAVRPSR